MKKSLSLLLAVLMVVAMIPTVGLAALAADSTSKYVVYQQNFDDVSTETTGVALMEQLGWYIPSAKVGTNEAVYSVVEKVVGQDATGKDIINKALRINTLEANFESFVNVFAGDVMTALRNSNFKLSYRLTYRAETTNNDGYAALIYNYNGLHGSVANGEGNEAYGIAAVRMCGTGFNAVYYPVKGASCDFHSLEKSADAPGTMSSRYDAPSGMPSLYARLFNASEGKNEVRTGTNVMANRILDIEISYDYKEGVYVDINGVRVSEMNYDLQFNADYRNENLWEDFVTRNTASAVALLVQPGVVADIDDISISTTNIEAAGVNEDLPALLITEVMGTATNNWSEYIEIYNPNDYAVDVANYSLVYSSYSATGTATDAINESRKVKYTSYVKLADMFGTEIKNPCPQFFLNTKLAAEPSWAYATQWYFSDAEIALIQEAGYSVSKVDTTKYARGSKASGSNNYPYTSNTSGTYYLCNIEAGMRFNVMENGDYTPDANGNYYLAHYVENWNTRYTRGSSEYENNTMLNPGECMILRLSGAGTYMPGWTGGMTNNGSTSTEFASKGFRYNYKNYGLKQETKILVVSGMGIADADDITFAIGMAVDEKGNEIDYTKRYLSDYTFVESFVRYSPVIAIGNPTEADTMLDNANIGKGGSIQADYAAAYVYGVDASSNYRCGTMYTALTPTATSKTRTQSHVGALADYQKLVIGNFYERTEENPELMITEILPLTNNLEGEAKSAFTAIELTNVSNEAIDAYDYALVRNNLGLAGGVADTGFTRSTVLRPGNPVDQGTGNGAYFYFAEDCISNPETCILEPGETLVVWFLTDATYSSYYTDDEFGVDYFRQYWVNNGCPDMGLKGTDGEYAVKVVAVDGCDSATYNAPNADRVFSLSPSQSAVYGVANATLDVTSGLVTPEDVISIAYFGLCSTYFELNRTALPAADGSDTIYYANVLKCSIIPVNTGMRYVAGLTYSNRISAMKQTLKIQSYAYVSGNPYTTTNPAGGLKYTLEASCALQTPGLGTLEGEEAYCVKDSLFLGAQEGDDFVYRYFAENRNVIATLSGAAVSTTAGAAKLRFDSVVRLDTFTSLAATYGANFKVGMLIVDSSAINSNTDMTSKDALLSAGAIDVKSNLLYYTDDYAVMGASIEVSDYDTEYTAVAYMEVTTMDGTTHTYFSISTAERSVASVANFALKDTKSVADPVYQYEVGGKYSRFTAEERAVLESYAGN